MIKKNMPILTKAMIEEAQRRCAPASGATVARVLSVTYDTYKKWAKYYGIFDEYQSKVVRKKRNVSSYVYDKTPLSDILDGHIPQYSTTKLQARLIFEGIFPDACMTCGYDRARSDGVKPLLLIFKDGDVLNKRLENLLINCYNCAFDHVKDKRTFVNLIKKASGPRIIQNYNDAAFQPSDISSGLELTDEEKARIRQEIEANI